MRFRPLIGLAVAGALAATLPGLPAAAASRIPAPVPIQTGAGNPNSSKLTDPSSVLPSGWQKATDRAVTTAAAPDGLHVLVADEKDAYQWRTAATLAEPGYDTDEWIGQACVTGSGNAAVVVYAPRQFTNHASQAQAGAFAAVVDLNTGAVRKLAPRASLAYYNPGCGTGEDVALSTLVEGAQTTTTVWTVNATSATVTHQVTVAGQLTSATPYGAGLAGSLGSTLVSVNAAGTVGVLAAASGVPFRLHADRSGGLGYQVPVGGNVEVRRFAAGRSKLIGTGKLGQVQVAGTAGRVFLIGAGASGLSTPEGWTKLNAPADAAISTTGALAVAAAKTVKPGTLALSATVTGNGRAASFSLTPHAIAPEQGLAMSPALAKLGGARALTPSGLAQTNALAAVTAPSTVSYDPDAGCAVRRNDPAIQTLQATSQQVEWAADLAVTGNLMVNRPANWMGSGMPVSWKPQTLFPKHALTGGGSVPAQVLLGILAQESNTMQASPHAVDGVTGNVNQGGFYGDWISWSTVDCGYGVGQVTTGMSKADGTTFYNANQQKAIATDYASNIAASLNALIDKWNQLRAVNITAGDGVTGYIENWYLAAWAYNTGLQPNAANGNTTGCSPGPTCTDGAGNWGLGWANNPANPSYPFDRGQFNGNDDFDTKHPNLWPYQEKVIGWAFTPVTRYDYINGGWTKAYHQGSWLNLPRLPEFSTFCVATVNHCTPKATTDINGKAGAGLCGLSNSHCWWHQANTTWVSCVPPPGSSTPCGVSYPSYSTGAAEPANASVYPPDCTNPFGTSAVIVDDVTTASAVPCTRNWTNKGTFSLSFPANPPAGCSSNCINYPGKIDFHQLSTGFGGHLWFTHTQTTTSVTGKWTPPAGTTGWTRIEVHVPKSGATTKQADYVINLGNGQTRHRVVNQAWDSNTWVDLGAFNLAAGANVTLSNSSPNVALARVDGGDIAFDALAFIPSRQPVASYVVVGDSYSSGEANSPFDRDSDQDGFDDCHRSSTQAFGYQVMLPTASTSIAQMAAANQANYHSLACSGSDAIDMTQAAVEPGNTDNTDWRTVNNYHNGEVNQIDESGWLDQDTTLVTITAGGNDAGFSDVLKGCVLTISDCIFPSYHLTRSFGDFDQTYDRVDPQQLTDYEPYLIDKLRSHLAATYQQVHTKAPNAKIIVIGYPRLFSSVLPVSCDAFSYADQLWLNGMGDRLAQTISGAVADAKAAVPAMDISFIDSRDTFDGHGDCGSDPWINGLKIINQEYGFHPKAIGQSMLAVLVNARLING